jgi:quinol monooxygenase YgiN
MRMTHDPTIVVIHYQAQPGQGAAARRELAALIATVVREEPECLGIQLHQDLDDETRFLLYETWTSRGAYTGPHMQTPHIHAFIKAAPTLFTGPPAITFWQRTDDAAR